MPPKWTIYYSEASYTQIKWLSAINTYYLTGIQKWSAMQFWFEISHEVAGKRSGRLGNLMAGLGNQPPRRLTHMVWVINRKPQSSPWGLFYGLLEHPYNMVTDFRQSGISRRDQDWQDHSSHGLGNRASLAAQQYRTCLLIQEMEVWTPGSEDPPEKEMATHSSIPAWRTPWTEESGDLQSMGLQKSWMWLSH